MYGIKRVQETWGLGDKTYRERENDKRRQAEGVNERKARERPGRAERSSQGPPRSVEHVEGLMGAPEEVWLRVRGRVLG